MQRPLRLILEVRWVGPRRRSGGRRTQVVGGRFVEPSDTLRKRLRALLRFEEARPQVTLQALLAPLQRPKVSAKAASKRRKSQHKR
jgi:Arc/MetJ-type ribon-helix-helix transcriptional regulator